MAKLIIPPTDIRVVIEKTAGFVAKNGSEFEAKIHENERHNPKFTFMNPNDPYNMYYRKRLQELVEGGQDAIAKAINDSKASEAQASFHMDQSGGNDTLESREVIADGQNEHLTIENLEFLVQLPTISALDLDVLKLTAQFAAKNGKQFILHLSQKESRNPQFDFLKPHHNLHSFYQSLVKQYDLVLNPPKELLERVKRCAFNKNNHLKLVKQRVHIEKLERQRMIEQEAEQTAEMEAFSKIDWHDFSVAETVNFGPEDQHKELPGPLSSQILRTMPLIQRLEMWTGRKAEAETETISNNFANTEDDEEEMEIDEPSAFTPSLIVPIISTVSKPNEIIMGAAFGSGAPIKVRTDYVPRAVSNSNGSGTTQICSICNASVPVSQIDEHIRIELLDPKWRTQRLAMMGKNKESNLVETGTDVSKNLDALAKHRQDIFTPSSATNSSSASIERGPTRPIWDGRADSVGQINRAAQILAKPQIEKEMEALKKSGDYSLDPSKGIGPRAPTQIMPTQGQGYPSAQGYHPTQGFPPMQGFPPLPPHGFPPFPQMPQGYPQMPPQGYPPVQPGFSQMPQGYPPMPHVYPPMPHGYPPMQQGYPPMFPPNIQNPPPKPDEKKK